MSMDKLRYALTEHIERLFYVYENRKLLIHPSITGQSDLLNRLLDDIELMPEIKMAQDKVDIKFYRYGYSEDIFNKSELLAFIYSSINPDWDIIKGIDISTGNVHYWLTNNNTIYDPSLAIITNKYMYSKKFKQLKKIKNEDIENYLIENNNLYKFYVKDFSESLIEKMLLIFL